MTPTAPTVSRTAAALAQAPLVLPLVIAAAALLVGAAVLGWIVVRRRREREALEALERRHRLEPVNDADRRETLQRIAVDLFGEGPRIERMLHRPRQPLDVFVLRLHLPLYRVDRGGVWDPRLQESRRKVLILVTGFETALPVFRLMPNSWALSTIRGKKGNLFAAVEPFGRRNYVVASDRRWVRHVLGEPVQHLLRDNRNLVIDGRPAYLAFALQEERSGRAHLARFYDACLELARVIDDRAGTYDPGASAFCARA